MGMPGIADIVPWLALIGAAGSATAVIKYYQDRAKAREDRIRTEQHLSDRIELLQQSSAELENQLNDARSALQKSEEAMSTAMQARARAELAREELHQAQLTFAKDYVSNRDLGASEKRLADSMDQLRDELRGMNVRLDRILERAVGSPKH